MTQQFLRYMISKHSSERSLGAVRRKAHDSISWNGENWKENTSHQKNE